MVEGDYYIYGSIHNGDYYIVKCLMVSNGETFSGEVIEEDYPIDPSIRVGAVCNDFAKGFFKEYNPYKTLYRIW